MTDLFDIVVRRQIYIEGLKHGKAKEFAAVLEQLSKLLRVRLNAVEFDDLGSMTRKALRALIIDLKDIARKTFDPWLKSLLRFLEDFCHADADLLAAVYSEAVPETEVEDKDNKKLFAAAWGLPMAATGTLALPFLLAFIPSATVKIERLVMQHWSNRSKRQDLIRAIVGSSDARKTPVVRGGPLIAGDADTLRAFARQANAVASTVVQHLAANNGNSLGKKFAPYYEWVSILDEVTTKICRSRDGKRWIVGKGPVPPAHIGCRSTTVPIFDLKTPSRKESFVKWIAAQSTTFRDDAFDAAPSTQYEGSRAISLEDYKGKRRLIGVK